MGSVFCPRSECVATHSGFQCTDKGKFVEGVCTNTRLVVTSVSVGHVGVGLT